MGSASEREESDDDYSILDETTSEEASLYHKDDDINSDARKESRMQRVAFGNLLKCSLLMFTLPFVTMYGCYFLMKERPGWTSNSALVLAAFAASAVVYIIIAMFVYVAYKEEKKNAELSGNVKKD